MDVESLSNEEVREALVNRGIAVGPVVDSTRIVYVNKLKRILEKENEGDPPLRSNIFENASEPSSERNGCELAPLELLEPLDAPLWDSSFPAQQTNGFGPSFRTFHQEHDVNAPPVIARIANRELNPALGTTAARETAQTMNVDTPRQWANAGDNRGSTVSETVLRNREQEEEKHEVADYCDYRGEESSHIVPSSGYRSSTWMSESPQFNSHSGRYVQKAVKRKQGTSKRGYVVAIVVTIAAVFCFFVLQNLANSINEGEGNHEEV